MLFFGYIVTKTKYNDLKNDVVKVVGDLSECTEQLPKLIVGLDESKEYAKLMNFDFDILNHTFPNGDMWTFKKTEKREYYENDVNTFKKSIIEHQKNTVKYQYINVYKLKYSEIKRLYNILFNNKTKDVINYFIIDGNMLYLSLNENNVIGISFSHLAYIGIKRDKIIDKIKNNSRNRVYFTTSRNMWDLKRWYSGCEYVIASIFMNNAKK